ncbi:MAG: RHS repeat protein [Blastochloris sp.]|nr:RHS repeat protein [Blastochloris sp.]
MKKQTSWLMVLLGMLVAGQVWANTGTPCGNTSPGGGTQPPCCPPDTSGGANPFNVYTGNVTRESLDLQVWGSVGEQPLQWLRQSNSRFSTSSDRIFGQGGNWRHNFQWSVADAGGTASNGTRQIQINHPLGGQYVFREQGLGSNLWLPAANVSQRVVQDGNNFVLVQADGERFYFLKTGTYTYRPLGVEDSQGNYTSFSYNAEGRLARVTEAAGRYLELSYQQITLDQRSKTKITNIGGGGTAGQWKTFTLTTPLERRYGTYEGTWNSYSRVAEVEFYDENNVKLTGTPISSPPAAGYSAANAFDEDPATIYRAPHANYSYVGLDFGSPKKIKKVRVLLDYNQSTSPGGDVYAFNSAPAPVTVLASVQSSDGRSVQYEYEQKVDSNPDVPLSYLVLSKARFGDGTEALYTYTQLYPMTTPLVETAIDPRATGRSTQIKYAYNTQWGAPLGMIWKEIDLPTGDLLVTLGASSGHHPVVTYANGRVQKFTFNNINANATDYTDGRGKKSFYSHGAGGGGFLTSQKDNLGRIKNYGPRDPLGNNLSITQPDGTVETWTRNAIGQPLTHTLSGPGITPRSTTWTRDSLNRVTRMDYPDGTFVTMSYNVFGQVTEKRGTQRSENLYDLRTHGSLVEQNHRPGGSWLPRPDQRLYLRRP